MGTIINLIKNFINNKKTQEQLVKGEHFIYKIKRFLQDNNFTNEQSIIVNIRERNNGKCFTICEHVRGMVYSLLSNQRQWAGIAIHIDDIDKIFIILI